MSIQPIPADLLVVLVNVVPRNSSSLGEIYAFCYENAEFAQSLGNVPMLYLK